MNKAIYFDMDGTLAELYKVYNWLSLLRAESPIPYEVAQPKVDMDELRKVLETLKKDGYHIGVISWLAKNGSRSYNKAVREAKKNWLKKHLDFEFDEVHIVKYGTSKHLIAKIKRGLLVDDNNDVCEAWLRNGGRAIDAESYSWLTELKKVLENN